MARIYVSSTFVDLREHRAKVIETLRQLGHEVVAMENYVAEDQIPLETCVRDVSSCEIYIGIFGWRYGFIPDGNQTGLSITEHEYRQAEQQHIPRLIFLLEASCPWPPHYIDAFSGDNEKGQRIRSFREELQRKRLVSFFTSPDDLARTVGVSVSLSAAKAWLNPLEGAEALADVVRTPLGSSLTLDIMKAIKSLTRNVGNVQVLEINLRNGDYWWSSRLFLVAALAVEHTSVGCLAFVTEGNRFFGLASPWATLLSLSKAFPEVAKAYYGTLRQPTPNVDPTDEIVSRVQDFSIAIGQLQGGEAANKVIVSQALLRQWLGAELVQEGLETNSLALGPLDAFRVLDRHSPYVALVREGELVGVVDRAAFATNVARGVFKARLGNTTLNRSEE
jgi:hypothetical protein